MSLFPKLLDVTYKRLFTSMSIFDFRKIISELVEGHYGRVVDSSGDSILVEFASAVDALNRVRESLKKSGLG